MSSYLCKILSVLSLCIIFYSDFSYTTYIHSYSDVIDFFPEYAENLTSVQWSYPIDKNGLLKALQEPPVMIAVTVRAGRFRNNPNISIPVIKNPNTHNSAITLIDLLETVINFNNNETNYRNKKGLKLHFRSTDAFNASLPILRRKMNEVSFPLWLSANILPGPNCCIAPLNYSFFLRGNQEFLAQTLSISWTGKHVSRNSLYTLQNINQMIAVVSMNSVMQRLNFRVRALLAANSASQLKLLMNTVAGSTLTVIVDDEDEVDVNKLKRTIFKIGLDKVFIDVPEKLYNELRLHEPPKFHRVSGRSENDKLRLD